MTAKASAWLQGHRDAGGSKPARAAEPVLCAILPVRLTLADRFSMMRNVMPLMLGIGLVVGLAGLIAALSIRPQYLAVAYFAAAPAPNYGGGYIAPDVRNELRIMQSDALAAKVAGQIGVRRLAPEIDASVTGYKRRDAALAAIRLGLKAEMNSDGGVTLSFLSHDPQVPALVLEEIWREYIQRRRDAASQSFPAPLAKQRRLTDGRLALANEAMQAFLKKNQIGDLKVEMEASTALINALAHDVAIGKADVSKAESLLQSAREAGDQKLAVARLQSDVTAEVKRLTSLQGEAAKAHKRLQELRLLLPEYERLTFARDMVASALRQSNEREEIARASIALVGNAAPVLQRAGRTIVTQLHPNRRMFAAFGAAFMAVTAALLAGFACTLRTAKLPTPDAAERYLGLPVLAVAPRVRRRAK